MAGSKLMVLDIPELHAIQMYVEINGRTPLICNRMSERKLLGPGGIAAGQAPTEEIVLGPKGEPKREPRNPQREFEDSMHRIYRPNGEFDCFGFPAIGVKKAMLNAAGRFVQGAVLTQLAGQFFIDADLLPIIHPTPPTMRQDRVVHSQVTNVAYRAQFNPWSMIIPITYFSEYLTHNKVVNLLSLAGKSVGIGDWRVDKKGSFGTWAIGKMEIVDRSATDAMAAD